MNNENLTTEFKEKAKDKNPEEIIALAQDEGVELTDEQLEAVSGGWVGKTCPKCGSDNCTLADNVVDYRCYDCGYVW